MGNPDNETAVAVTSTSDPGTSYLEWGAIFGGTAIAGAISMVLLQFGSAIGLAAGPAYLDDLSPSWNVLVAGLWVVLVALSSSAAGGYVAGRMRSRRGDAIEAEVEFRDGAHGLVTWGTATVVSGVIAASLGALSAAGATAMTKSVDISAEMLNISANVSSIFAFAIAAGAALGAAAAWFAAISGGEHRDQGLSVHEVVPKAFRRRLAK